MSAHTPGPWTSYPCNLERYSRVITAKGAMVRVAYTGLNHHDQVAMTKEVYGDRMTYGPGEETTANARLIVAAPDHHAVALELERLMLVIESAVRHSDPRNHAAVMLLLTANRAAIAKATGGAA